MALAGAMLVPEQRVEACGPDFPTNMIIRRADALATMWDGSFAEEAAKLVPVSDRERAALRIPRAPAARAPAALAIRGEPVARAGLGPRTAPAVRHEPAIASAREITMYIAAAREFHTQAYAEAARGFDALLRLPAGERRRFSVAAAYSLGRAYYADYKDARAIAAFHQVRALVRAGFPDMQDLARSSLGEEARTAAREDTAVAIRLYAQQAALGDTTGITSLLEVVRRTTKADRRALYRDDVATSLLALYFYTRGHELSDDERPVWKRELEGAVTTAARGAAYMAAATYRAGDWAAAAKFAHRSKSPIATWVRAKLALRDGDRTKAEMLLREVERAGLAGNAVASEIASYTLDYDPSSLVRAELGLLALASDRFTESAEWFAKAQREPEAAYVIERAMSRDELLAAVQRTQSARVKRPDGASDTCGFWQPVSDADRTYCWGTLLLNIYTRRLLRDQRYDDALEAFGADRPTHADGEDADGDESTENDPDPAGSFVRSMKRAAATTGIERAEHLFAASRTLRVYGMDFAGTEVGPDWRIYGGNYEGETLCMPSPTRGYDKLAVLDEDGYYIDADHERNCTLPTKPDAALVTPLEATRVRASAPEIDKRFSYRYVASGLAEEAAGLLPPRSQAYATTLCWAAKYASRDRARTDEIYAMYVRNGASGFDIGANCEEPDFSRARNFDAEQAQRRVDEADAAHRARWSWPRIRDAAWRRRGWLVYPFAALLLFLIARFALSRAAYAPGFARDSTESTVKKRTTVTKRSR